VGLELEGPIGPPRERAEESLLAEIASPLVAQVSKVGATEVRVAQRDETGHYSVNPLPASRGTGGSGDGPVTPLRYSSYRKTWAGRAKGASRFVTMASPGMSVWISGPRSEMSCLEDPRRMLRSFSSARPRMKKVLNWDRSSSSISFGCWLTAHSPTLNLRPSRATLGNTFSSARCTFESTRWASSSAISVGGRAAN